MMKKITLIAAVIAAFSMNAQTTLFEEDFDLEVPDAVTFDQFDSRDLDGDGNFWEVADVVGTPAETSPIEGLMADSDSWEGGTAFSPDNLLVTKDPIDLSGVTSGELTFIMGTYQNAGTFLGDRLQVLVTTSDDTADIIAATPAFDMTVGEVTPADNGGENSAAEVTVDLSAYADQVVYITFRHFDTTDENSVLIDQVLVTDGALSVDDVNTNGFAQFVDADSNLNLRANVALQNVELFNIVGQQVMNRSLSSNNESISLASLTDGVYIARVMVQGQTETFKIIKR